jgi:two-component system, OmpR family, sensor histidine kinase MprB
MSFRLRLTLLASLAVAVAVAGTAIVVYYTDRQELIGQVDSDLSSTLTLPPLNAVIATGARRFGQVTAVGGEIHTPSSRLVSHRIPPGVFKVLLPRISTAVQAQVTLRTTRGTASKAPPRFTTATVKGVPTRVLTIVTPTETVSVRRSLLEVDRNLAHLRWLLVFISLGGIGAAAILGALVSGRAVAPLRRLTETTERIVETGDLTERTGRRGRDEISRLSTRLDELLASLEASLRTQRQLVADASHELRTPLTTLRASIGLLARPGTLAASERAGLLADVEDELEAMTTLVGELVELARGEEPGVAQREFRLDEVVRSVVERTAKRAPTVSFRTQLEPSVISGVPERVERAVSNLLDNASKWSPANETIEVAVHNGVVVVRDHGPGIAAEDRPLVFNRFYRSGKARGMPGAGLGLAIVKQIADAHGGSVTVDDAPDGGAILRLQLSSTG